MPNHSSKPNIDLTLPSNRVPILLQFNEIRKFSFFINAREPGHIKALVNWNCNSATPPPLAISFE